MLDHESLQNARLLVEDNIEKGIECPCCGKFCKLYKRKLHTEMALFLIKLVKLYQKTNDWVHSTEIIKSTAKASSDGSYLVHWNLVISKPAYSSKSKSSGYWKPTENGIEFVNLKIRVPAKVRLYNNKVQGWSDSTISIIEALGNKFNYSELMRE